MGKKGDRAAQTRASAFLLQPALIPKLFGTFAKRYADRPGGYTRIHKFGNRLGDNAPHAILELVDNPRDLRWEMTSRAIGWEMLKEKLKSQRPVSIINSGAEGTRDVVEAERTVGLGETGGILRPKTRWNLQKVLKFREQDASLEMSQKVGDYMVSASVSALSCLLKLFSFRTTYWPPQWLSGAFTRRSRRKKFTNTPVVQELDKRYQETLVLLWICLVANLDIDGHHPKALS